MTRNREIRLVEVLPAATPHEVIVEWAAELTVKPAPADLSELEDRLREALVVDEDRALAGGRLVEAIDSQADRTCGWTHKNKLRFLARNVEATLREPCRCIMSVPLPPDSPGYAAIVQSCALAAKRS